MTVPEPFFDVYRQGFVAFVVSLMAAIRALCFLQFAAMWLNIDFVLVKGFCGGHTIIAFAVGLTDDLNPCCCLPIGTTGTGLSACFSSQR